MWAKILQFASRGYQSLRVKVDETQEKYLNVLPSQLNLESMSTFNLRRCSTSVSYRRIFIERQQSRRRDKAGLPPGRFLASIEGSLHLRAVSRPRPEDELLGRAQYFILAPGYEKGSQTVSNGGRW